MQDSWLDRILSRLTASGRRYKSERAEFISSNAMFYKVLGKEKKEKRKKMLRSKRNQEME